MFAATLSFAVMVSRAFLINKTYPFAKGIYKLIN
jgi:hypothetical protein